jgi:phage-related protein
MAKGIGKGIADGDGKAVLSGFSGGIASVGNGLGNGFESAVMGAADGVLTCGEGLASGVRSIGSGFANAFGGKKKPRHDPLQGGLR